jgi:tRNA threonylcarbamoyladenosine biosynthesis protein TsaB
VITLAVDGSTYVGSVCVASGREVVAAREVAMRDARSDRLMPAISAALADAGLAPTRVDRIVCGAGPGSFTSLRIAAAISKGLAMALNRPLFAVSSLALMVGSAASPLEAGEYLAVLDALRGEVYAAACTVDGSGEVVDVAPVGLLRVEELDTIDRATCVIVGERGAVRAAPNARGVVRAEPLLARNGPVDVDQWEPDYGRVAEAQRRWEAAHGRTLPRG